MQGGSFVPFVLPFPGMSLPLAGARPAWEQPQRQPPAHVDGTHAAVQARRGSASGPHPNPRPHPLPSEAEFPEGLRGMSAAFVILSFHVVVFLLDSGNQIMRQRRPGGTSFYSLFGRFFAVPNLLCPQQPIQHQALEKWAIQAPGNWVTFSQGRESLSMKTGRARSSSIAGTPEVTATRSLKGGLWSGNMLSVLFRWRSTTWHFYSPECNLALQVWRWRFSRPPHFRCRLDVWMSACTSGNSEFPLSPEPGLPFGVPAALRSFPASA